MAERRSEWAGRPVLVTGGAGFLGGRLCHALDRLGADILVVDNFLEGGGGNPVNLAGVRARLVRADLRDADLTPLVAGRECVFNLAAQTGHRRGQRDPGEDLEINALAQLRLIAAVRTAAPSAIVVHASTRQVYGPTPLLPVSESSPAAPPDANAIAKLAGEQYWLMERRLHGRAVACLRLTNCYGPGQRVRDAEQSFLGFWIGAILRGVPFEVWGGGQERDLCHADDAVAALLLAAETAACHGGVFNVGGHSAHSVRALAELLRRDEGAAFTMRPMPPEQAAIDMGSFVADDTRFRAATGWAPRVPLSDGLGETIAWFRARADAYL